MPLSRERAIFTERWQAGLVTGVVAAMPATVTVFTRSTSYADNRPVTVETEIYSGVARVQPARTPRRNPEVGDTRVDQSVRFQVVLNALEFVPDKMFVRVTECPLNPALVDGAVYALSATTDGGNPIERTFEAVADTSGQ